MPTSNNTTQLMADKDLTLLIRNVCNTARNTQTELQKALEQSVMHAHANGNLNHITYLINNLPNSSRVRTIMQYIKVFSPVKFKAALDVKGQPMLQQDGREKVTAKLRAKAVEGDWNIEGMQAVTYYDWSKPKVEKEVEFDLAETIKRFIKKVDSALGKGLEPVKADALRVQRNLATQQLTAMGVTL